MNKSSIIRALRFILNSDLLDLTLDTSKAHYGLRFYTEFNRIDAVYEMPKLLANNLINLTANIITPVDYPSRVDNLMREIFIPTTDIVCVALVVKEDKLDEFISELSNVYDWSRLPSESNVNCNREIAELLINNKDTDSFEIAIDAIDRSNNPAKGKVIFIDDDLIWIKGIDTDVPPTFYIVSMNKIPFICK